ncbi:UvrD-helicase domain-containing protein [Planctomycetota bacterium]
MHRTKAQEKAVTGIDKSVMVTASAGSGKTMVLVDRYLELLIQGKAGVSEIVAITFTDKAATQMRQRVCEKITSLAENDPARWSPVRLQILQARISTFHSFCGSLLREHALEFGLSPDFTQMESFENRLLLENKIPAWLDERLVASDKAVRELAGVFGFDRLAGMLGILYHARFDVSEFQEFRKKALLTVPEVRAVFEEYLQAELTVFLTDLKTAVLEPLAAVEFDNAADKLAIQIPPVIDSIMAIDTATDPLAALACMQEVPGQFNLRSGSRTDAGKEPAKHLIKILKKKIASLQPFFKIFDCAEEDKVIHLSNLILSQHDILRAHLDDLKRQRGLVDFEDLQLYALQLLRDFPKIRARVRGGIKTILVDEYQDTNPIQQAIIDELTLADGSIIPGRLFVVGDGKQSIYRFRGADVSIFNRMAGRLPEDDKVLLDKNFRSHPALLDYFNAVFTRLFPTIPRDYEASYEKIDYGKSSEDFCAGDLAPVTILLARGDSGKDGAGKKLSIGDKRALEAEMLARWLLFEKDRLKDEFQFGHTAVLFRAFSSLHIYENAFKKYNLPYVIAGGRGFYSQVEIRDMYIFLRAVVNPFDDLFVAALLRCPVFGITDDGLWRLRQQGGGGYLWDQLRAQNTELTVPDAEVCKKAITFIQLGRELAGKLPFDMLLKSLVESVDYDLYLATGHQAERTLGNLEKLYRNLRSLWQKGLTDLPGCARYIEDCIQREEHEGEAILHDSADAVQVLTIHKAKGLEFENVILPDLLRVSQRIDTPPIVFDRRWGPGFSLPAPGASLLPSVVGTLIGIHGRYQDQAEIRRLLYVAMTRAARRLVLCGFDGETKSGELHVTMGDAKNWMETFEFLHPLGDDDNLSRLGIQVHRESFDGIKPFCRPATEVAPITDDIFNKNSQVLAIPARKYFSASQVYTALQCRKLYFHKYVQPSPVMWEDDKSSRAMDAAAFGTLVHSYFERVLLHDPESDEAWIRKAAAIQDGLDRQARQELAGSLQNIAAQFRASSLCQDMKAATCQRELPFQLAAGDYVIRGIIDLVLESGEGARIVDYKTNRSRPELEEYLRTQYNPQLQLYQLAYEQLCGPVSMLQLYSTSLAAMVEVPRVLDADVFKDKISRTLELISDEDFTCDHGDCEFCRDFNLKTV